MPRISPFTALLFDPAVVGSLDLVTAPPYDAIDADARRRYLDRSPYNVVRLDLGNEAQGASRGPSQYRRARDLLRSWIGSGVLSGPTEPRLFAYEMRFSLAGAPRSILGALCAIELEEWGGSIVPHERTMPGPVSDRLAQMRATRANLSPVYGTIAGPSAALRDALERAAATPPLLACLDDEGVEHRAWNVGDARAVAAALADEEIMIADGHHRYATALLYRDEMRRRRGAGPWDALLALIVDAALERPPVLPFHRIVIAGDPPVAGEPVGGLHELLGRLDDEHLVYGIAVRERRGIAHRVGRLAGRPPTVRELHARLLDGRVADDALRFTPDAAAAERAVATGAARAAYFLPPTTVEAVRAAVIAGERLPQKSTFFWPKPRTGMAIRPLWDVSPPRPARAS